MNRIFFSRDVSGLIENTIKSSFSLATVVYHEIYGRPQIEAEQIIPWQRYRKVYQEIKASEIVLVGLNRMITPSNRCDFVHDYLTTLTPNIPKVSVDTAPFVGEPWRLYFHYLFTNMNKFGYSYSYPIEGEWKKWFLRETNDCRISENNIRMFIHETYSDLSPVGSIFSFYDVSEDQEKWYEEVKEYVFHKYNGPKSWVLGLLSQCNKKFELKFGYDSYLEDQEFSLPDLGVYRFVVIENQRRQSIYNCFSSEQLG